MKAAADVLFAEKIISMLIDGLHDEASSALARADHQLDVEHATRLAALVRIDRDKLERVAQVSERQRRAYQENGTWIAYLFRLGTDLIDIERWTDAEVVLDELVALSQAKDEAYFLDDARLLRALCLKYLGRKREMEDVTSEMSSDASVFICRDDLGGCIQLTRKHLV